jgi:hypothetical protein
LLGVPVIPFTVTYTVVAREVVSGSATVRFLNTSTV